jgi:DNA-binding MarR family transcriptional regulator
MMGAQDDNNVDLKIALALEKLIHVQRMLLWDEAKKEGLSPIQIQMLSFLSGCPEGQRRVSCMAAEFDLTKATVSDAAASLIDKGLLVKKIDAGDKRSHMLSLTQEGRKTEKRLSGWHDRLTENISSLRNVDKNGVMLFLMELIKSLHDSGIINAARLCIACGNFEKDLKPGAGKPHRCGLTGKYMSDGELTIGCASCAMH